MLRKVLVAQADPQLRPGGVANSLEETGDVSEEARAAFGPRKAAGRPPLHSTGSIPIPPLRVQTSASSVERIDATGTSPLTSTLARSSEEKLERGVPIPIPKIGSQIPPSDDEFAGSPSHTPRSTSPSAMGSGYLSVPPGMGAGRQSSRIIASVVAQRRSKNGAPGFDDYFNLSESEQSSENEAVSSTGEGEEVEEEDEGNVVVEEVRRRLKERSGKGKAGKKARSQSSSADAAKKPDSDEEDQKPELEQLSSQDEMLSSVSHTSTSTTPLTRNIVSEGVSGVNLTPSTDAVVVEVARKKKSRRKESSEKRSESRGRKDERDRDVESEKHGEGRKSRKKNKGKEVEELEMEVSGEGTRKDRSSSRRGSPTPPDEPSWGKRRRKSRSRSGKSKSKSRTRSKSKQKTKPKKRSKKKLVLGPNHFLSEILLLWVFKLVATINGISTLAKVNLGLKKSETAKVNGDLLDGFWSEEFKEHPRNPSLFRALFKAFGKTYMLLSLWKISWGAFAWLGAYYVLRNLIRWTETLEDAWQGHVWALVLFACSVLGAISYHQMLTQCLRIAVQSRSALLVLIYRKSLRLSYVKGGIGDIVNLISNECNRIAELCVSFHFMWSAAIEGLVICVLIGIDLQVSAIPAIILIIIITMPLQYFLGILSAKASYTSTTLLTRRVALVNEVLTTIKLIKFYAWEKYYTAKLTGLREKEMGSTKRALLFKIGGFASVFITPVVSTLMSLVGLQYLGSGTSIRQVTASEVFTILSLFNTLRYPLMMLPQAVRSFAGAQRAVKKLEDFFTLPEIDALPAGPSPAPSESSSDPSTLLLTFENASFVWDGDLDHPHIYDLNLQLYRGQLLAIVGDVGSGRSLLAAIMGQIKLVGENDRVAHRYGTCGYVPQEPWLINASIQDNILFGLEYDERKYSDVVRLCGLTRDLMLLSNGDQSLVSDLNLSAAQSQRLSLARCLYHDPEIILLDDILSDFDLAIAKRLFKEAIKNYMLKSRGKSVVLVTQQKQFLPDCDQILVMKGGRVVERGTFAELKARKINFSAFISDIAPIEDDPTGVLEKVNEIRLEPFYVPPNASVNTFVHVPSPLATAEVITMDDTVSATGTFSSGVLNFGVPLNPEDANQLTIQQLQQLNSASVQQSQLTEETISKMIERNQLSVITSGGGLATSLLSSRGLDVAAPTPNSGRADSISSGFGNDGSPDTGIPVAPSPGTSPAKSVFTPQASASILPTINSPSPNVATAAEASGMSQPAVLVTAGTAGTGGSASIGSSRRSRAAPVNFENQNVVTKTIQENQLTMHTVDDFAAIGRHFGFTPGGEDRGEGIAAQKSIYERPFASYRIYMVIGSRGAWVAGIFIFAYYLVHAFRFFSDYWLAVIVDRDFGLDNVQYIVIYAAICLIISIGVLARGFLTLGGILRKSRALHKRVLESVMKAPMSFFDITPLGQILSNFARHLYQVDEQLPESMLQALAFSPILVGTVILVSIVVPWFWATLPLYAVLVWWLISRSNMATEKLKQLEALNKSPLFAHLSATLEGLFSIRLYHAEARFDAFNRTLIDADQKALYSLMLVKSMTALYVDLICALFIYMTALLVVVSRVKPSYAGLALANSLQLLLFAQWFVRSATDTHAAMQSVSAATYFAEHIPHEAPEIVKSNRPAPDWPSLGEIDFKNVVLRYNRYGVAVLKSVSFRIHHKERIGVVGRSGSGKTTLLVALLRIVELAQGEITVDGIDIRQIGLADLRSRIAVIPQEPVLLTGTIRSNLDPFGVRSDEEVWKALKSAHLGDKIHEMPLQLETPITENGKAFTQGERQLFCIARAVLLKSSIVVLDEPATAVDPETDELIRSVMAENFSEATVILLASRFNVVVELDKVIVMEHGKVVEFDSPLALLENPRSKFSLMVAQSGEIDVSKLRNVAQGRADRRARGNASGSSSLSPVGSSASRFSRPRGASTGGGQPPQTPQAAGVQLHPLANSISAHDVQSTVSTTSSAKSDGNSKMPRSLEDLFNPHHSPAAVGSGGRTSPPTALETPTSVSPSRGHLSKLSVVTNDGHVPSSPSSAVGSPAGISSSAPSTYLALSGSPVTVSPSANGLGVFLPSYHQYRPATPDGEFEQRKDDSS